MRHHVLALLLGGVLLAGCDFGAPPSRRGGGRRGESDSRSAPASAPAASFPRVSFDSRRSGSGPSASRPRVERRSEPSVSGGDVAWTPLFVGIDHTELRATRPRRMVGQVLRIDLTAEGIEFLTTPSNGDRPGETDGLKTTSFLGRYRLQAAINAAPFSPIWNWEDRQQEIQGLQISAGELVSPPSRLPAILITRDNKVTIKEPPFDLRGVYNAVCGYNMILDNGRSVGRWNDVHPRVAVGVSRDGRWLFFLVVDGRQWGHSDGATCDELAEWLRALGSWDAINLDGGGTTSMAVADPHGRPRLVNRPIHNGIPGNQRVSGSHLGVRARPLPE